MANIAITLNNDNTTIPLLAFGTGTVHNNKDVQVLVAAAIDAGALQERGLASARASQPQESPATSCSSRRRLIVVVER
jgi:hypothetical protein